MTGHDHTDALTGALRQPALPAEHAGEASAVASMAGALPTAAAAGGGRPRKGVAILAVTVASLGVGGLAAAGPGILPRGFDFILGDAPATPATIAEHPANRPASEVVPGGSSAAQPATPDAEPAAPAIPANPVVAVMPGDPTDTREAGDTGGVGSVGGADAQDPADEGSVQESCVEDGHGQDVADTAGSPDDASDPAGLAVSVVARPDCGTAADAPIGGLEGGSDDATVSAPGEPAEPDTPQPVAADVPQPDVPEPDTPQPDTPQPDVPQPNPPEPDEPQPDVPEPDVPKPDVPKPDVPEPDVPRPDVPKPDVPKPDVPKPDVPKPDVPEPDVPKPDVPEPDVPRPDTPRPSTPIDVGGSSRNATTPTPEPGTAGQTAVRAPGRSAVSGVHRGSALVD